MTSPFGDKPLEEKKSPFGDDPFEMEVKSLGIPESPVSSIPQGASEFLLDTAAGLYGMSKAGLQSLFSDWDNPETRAQLESTMQAQPWYKQGNEDHPVNAAIKEGISEVGDIANEAAANYFGLYNPAVGDAIRERGLLEGGARTVAENLGMSPAASGLIEPVAQASATLVGGRQALKKPKDYTPPKQETIDRIKNGDTSPDLVEYKVVVDPFSNKERLIRNPVATRLIDKGLNPETISGIERTIQDSKIIDPTRSTSKALNLKAPKDINRDMYLEAIRVARERVKSGQGEILPRNVLGKGLNDMLVYLDDVKANLTPKIDKLAAKIAPDNFDISDLTDEFFDALRADDIADITLKPDGSFDVKFLKNSIGKAQGPTKKLINDMLRRMKADGNGATSSLQVHKLKQWVYENVKYGDQARKASDRVENLVKGFASKINDRLRQADPEGYAKVNDDIKAILDVNDLLASAMPIKKLRKAGEYRPSMLGDASRRLLGNGGNPVLLQKAFNDAQRVYLEQGGKLKFDIMAQANFIRDLEDIFDTGAKGGFEALNKSGTAKGIYGPQEYATMKVMERVEKARARMGRRSGDLLDALDMYEELIKGM